MDRCISVVDGIHKTFNGIWILRYLWPLNCIWNETLNLFVCLAQKNRPILQIEAILDLILSYFSLSLSRSKNRKLSNITCLNRMIRNFGSYTVKSSRGNSGENGRERMNKQASEWKKAREREGEREIWDVCVYVKPKKCIIFFRKCCTFFAFMNTITHEYAGMRAYVCVSALPWLKPVCPTKWDWTGMLGVAHSRMDMLDSAKQIYSVCKSLNCVRFGNL